MRRTECNCANCLCRFAPTPEENLCGLRPPTGRDSQPLVDLNGWCTYWTSKTGQQPFMYLAPIATYTPTRGTLRALLPTAQNRKGGAE